MSTDRRTALHGIARMEATGLWTRPDGRQQEVVVSLGESTLTLTDTADDPLAHWALPALERFDDPGHDGGADRATYAPAALSVERLEIADAAMIAALERLRAAVAAPRRAPGRLRRGLVLAGIGTLSLAAAAFGPGVAREQAARLMPPAERAATGLAMAEAAQRVAGPACTSPLGDEALDVLAERLDPANPPALMVLPDLPVPAVSLPGDRTLLARDALLAEDDPDAAAGHLVAARAGGREAPLAALLDRLGPFDLARLLTRGSVPEGPRDRAAAVLAAEGAPTDLDALPAAFAAARLDPAPWSAATGVTVPLPNAAPAAIPAMDDGAWQALRGICEG